MSDQILTVITEHVTESIVVLTATGEIDRESQSVLGEAAASALEGDNDRLVIDLSAVSFCDSSGLSLFVRLHRRLAERGGSLRLAGAQPLVRTVLEATNLHRLFPAYPTVEQAVQAALAAD
ncbi:STAS domain-containing protein [Actinoplanes sp. NPDC051343]|uniref:STAS domain-containing protein n=1 Tax=Actinoplanes sp. NPDC051343 TaxID=3363906 RepID=UPI0037A4D83E